MATTTRPARSMQRYLIAMTADITSKPPIVPLTIFAAGTREFEICTDVDAASIVPEVLRCIRANPSFRENGWRGGSFEVTLIAPCKLKEERLHWKVKKIK